jgi:hypothetical protein
MGHGLRHGRRCGFTDTVPAPEEFLSYITDSATVTAVQVAQATNQVLQGPTHREAPRRVATEIAALPPPAWRSQGLCRWALSGRSWGLSASVGRERADSPSADSALYFDCRQLPREQSQSVILDAHPGQAAAGRRAVPLYELSRVGGVLRSDFLNARRLSRTS